MEGLSLLHPLQLDQDKVQDARSITENELPKKFAAFLTLIVIFPLPFA
jgi:hypothetical protein